MRFLVPFLFGLTGFAVLVALGVWQLQRLDWKEGVIAQIEARITAAPVDLPPTPDQSADNFLPVRLDARVTGAPLRVLGAWRGGSGYRIVAPVETGGRRVLVDFGLVPLSASETTLAPGPYAIIGNLSWPDDVTSATPDPEGSTWFGRDVSAMADTLGTDPLMVVARTVTPSAGPQPLPVGVEGIPNSHLGYAIQWFGLALVWLGMTVFLLWRIRRRTL
ncbi:SURF1 family protein [Jannaschia sp. M317]|uniref:SURF1 family protein n=1 Tax=Jannaschia sp. M317 TaxID=2867011 RepID=UPI0021A6E0BF|nr:SURF1 family protein [Jannaschia sp. M317]UWQ18831.1 SURF1 family protein [Jannaschia sp. M317]